MLRITTAALAALTLLASGCAPGVPYGTLYTDAYTPLAATNNSNVERSGEACRMNVLGLVSFGDASTTAAAREGGITLISNVSKRTKTILGLYVKRCTLVVGN